MSVAMDFTYRREGDKAFCDMVDAVERSIRAHGFDVVGRHDLQATLAAKGFEIQPLVVLDVALPGAAIDLCKMHVYAEGSAVWVSAIRPLALWRELSGEADDDTARAEASVVSLVDGACA